jgi:DNA sulfur modification protein DndB
MQVVRTKAAGMVGVIRLPGILGFSADRRVLLGFAPANLLHSLSFADVLDEDTGRGYQRRFNPQHSLDFRRYIQTPQSSTIPLTFNLRPRSDSAWTLVEHTSPQATLEIAASAGRVLSQVDCQHRLGHLNDLAIPLPFMCYLGLSEKEEMEVFSVINSKAKGLSTSLLDFHEAQLVTDLAKEKPELFIALNLNDDNRSPWYKQLDLGGKSTSGMARRASLRTMQKAVKRFLQQTKITRTRSVEVAAQIVLDFWSAISVVLRDEWANPRRHFITKGIGVYALMGTAADLYLERTDGQACDKRYFVNALSDFAREIDWSNNGPLRGLGGESGAQSALELIRQERKRVRLKVVANG